MIGTYGLFFWDQITNMASLGYDLARPSWGQGLMREAAMAVLAYGFAVKNLNRINALTAVENWRSIHLLQALGFQEEAILRQFAFWKGAYHDMRIIALLQRELSASTLPCTTEMTLAQRPLATTQGLVSEGNPS